MSRWEGVDREKLEQVALAMLGLTMFTEHGQMRAWKGMDWDLLDALFERGWITDPKTKANSVVLSPEAARLAEEFLDQHFGLPAPTDPPNPGS